MGCRLALLRRCSHVFFRFFSLCRQSPLQVPSLLFFCEESRGMKSCLLYERRFVKRLQLVPHPQLSHDCLDVVRHIRHVRSGPREGREVGALLVDVGCGGLVTERAGDRLDLRHDSQQIGASDACDLGVSPASADQLRHLVKADGGGVSSLSRRRDRAEVKRNAPEMATCRLLLNQRRLHSSRQSHYQDRLCRQQ